MSTSVPIVDCTCRMTGGRLGCPLHSAPSVGVRDVATVYFGCPNGSHEWLPWCRLDDDSFVTRCIHCSREERIQP